MSINAATSRTLTYFIITKIVKKSLHSFETLKKPRTLKTVRVAKEDAVSCYRNFSRRYPNAFARKA